MEWSETLIATERNANLTGIAAIFMIFLSFTGIFLNAQAQTEITFTSKDKFGIPASNGTITFAANGTYTWASLENGIWNFVNLRLDNSQPLEKLEVSAQNSNVTITSYRSFNATLRGALLGYIVEGQGKQTFNLGLDPKRGEWSVIFNGVFMGEGDGWSTLPEGTLTITGATYNVTIAYYSFLDYFEVDRDSDQPLFQQHSVVIITTVALATTVILTLAIRRKNKERLGKMKS